MAKTAIWPSRLIFLEDLPRELEAHQGELRLAMPCAWRRPRESTASHAFRMHAPHTHPPREWREFFGRLTRPHQLITLAFEVHHQVEPGRDRVARVEQGRARPDTTGSCGDGWPRLARQSIDPSSPRSMPLPPQQLLGTE